MNKRILAAATSLAFAISAHAQATISAKAREIHNSAIVIDTHADTPQRFLDENYDIGSTDPKDPGHISLDKAKAGNLGAEFFSIWVDPETNQGHFDRHTLDLIDSVYEQAARHPDRMMMAFSVADIERAHREHKLAALLGIEGGHSIENDVRVLRDFYRLGVRYMTLSWSNTNEWADSSGDIDNPKIEHHNGLTDGGKQIVVENEAAECSGRFGAATIPTGGAPGVPARLDGRDARGSIVMTYSDGAVPAVGARPGIVGPMPAPPATGQLGLRSADIPSTPLRSRSLSDPDLG